MSLGRISGQLLQSNLTRNGVDLDFRNAASDTPLLFFDVANNRLGVNKDAPGTDLDLIDNALRTTGLLAPTTNQSIANYTLTGSNLNVSTGDINFNAAEAIVASTIETDNIRITDNTISTFNSNASFDLTPNGTGIVDVLSDMKVFGNLDTPSTITMGGSITIGDNSSDTIDFNTDMISDLTPEVVAQASITAQFKPATVNGQYAPPYGSATGALSDVNGDGWIDKEDLRENEFSFGNMLGYPSIAFPFNNPNKLMFAFPESFRNQFATDGSDTLYINQPDGTPIIGFTVRNGWDPSGSNTYSSMYVEWFSSSSEVVYPPSIASLPRNSTTDYTDRREAIENLLNPILVSGNDYLLSKGPYGSLFIYDLGTANNSWDNIHSFRLNGSKLEVPNLKIDTNVITTLISNSNLDLRGNASGNVKLEDLEFATNIISTSTGNNLTLSNDNTIMSTTAAMQLAIGTTVQRPNVNSSIRFNTTTSNFEGYFGGNTIFGGVYSSNELTNVVAHPTNDTVSLTVNNTVIGTVAAIGITVHGLQVDNINVDGNIVSTATDTNLILAPAGNVSNKSVKIGNLFIGETVGTQQIKSDNNIIEFAVTGQGSTGIPSSYAFTIPSGTTANRPASPQLGDTRWNGVLEQMETYNGSDYISSAGTGGVISRADYDDLLLQYTILLG
jgi:hypothetical protein